MHRSRALPILAALLTGCTTVGPLLPGGPDMPAGSRQLVIPVENLSPGPALLEVTNDNPERPVQVGTADPSTVAAGETRDVTFSVPPGEAWAIIVNRQTLIIPMDVAGHSGPLPIKIHIDRAGQISWSSPGNWP